MPDAKQEPAKPSKIKSALKIGAGGVGGVIVGVIVENSTSIFGPAAGRVGAALEWFLFDTMPVPPWLLVLLALAGLACAGVLLRGLAGRLIRSWPRGIPEGQHPGATYCEDIVDLGMKDVPPLHVEWGWYSNRQPAIRRVHCAPHGSTLAYWSMLSMDARGCAFCSDSFQHPDHVKEFLSGAHNWLETEISRRANGEDWRGAAQRVKQAKMERNSHG